MKTFLSLIAIATVFAGPASFAASKTSKQIFQCAGAKVGRDGVRLNMIEQSNGKLRANLLFGTTVSGAMYNVVETSSAFKGVSSADPDLSINLVVTKEPARNKNVQGFRARLKVAYPTLESSRGFEYLETTFVCGKKIASR